uniref:Variant surface glycoprotein 771 n=1 Tax=Trypanosoma brucei TaxID=5691 RepID=M4SZ25_9TRYP|nr:variant surface glycoprotein 771 [Trypanosoma brucei]
MVLLIAHQSQRTVKGNTIHQTATTAENACQAVDDLDHMVAHINLKLQKQQGEISTATQRLVQLAAAAAKAATNRNPSIATLLGAAGRKLQAASAAYTAAAKPAAQLAANLAKLAGMQIMVAEQNATEIQGKNGAPVAGGAWFGQNGMPIQLKTIGAANLQCHNHLQTRPRKMATKEKVNGRYAVTFVHLAKATASTGTGPAGPRTCAKSAGGDQTCPADSTSSQTNILLAGGKLTKEALITYQTKSDSDPACKPTAKQPTEQMPPQGAFTDLLKNLDSVDQQIAKLTFKADDILPAALLDDEETKQALLQILKPGTARDKVSDHEKQIEELKKKPLKSDQTDASAKLWQEIGKTASPAAVAQSTKAEEISGIEDLGKLAATLGHYLVQEATKPASKEQCNSNKEEPGCDGKEQDKCNGKCEWKEINGKGECKPKDGEDGVKAGNDGKTNTNTTGSNSIVIKKAPL